MKILLVDIDSREFPNLALMRASAWYKSQGHDVRLTRRIHATLGEKYDLTLGFTVFTQSMKAIALAREQFPGIIIGGTGLGRAGLHMTLESVLNIPAGFQEKDYSLYPDFAPSLGFVFRGCRLACSFCIVGDKEGKPYKENSVYGLWRGGDHPKHIHLFDNDFFGHDGWREACDEIRRHNFKVCFSQGINIRLFNKEQAEILAGLKYYNTAFAKRVIYTAWDNKGHEKIFFRGVQTLMDAGIKPGHIRVYMLIGYQPGETLDDILYRVDKMREVGLDIYPMPYRDFESDALPDPLLMKIKRWVGSGVYRKSPFGEYKPSGYIYDKRRAEGQIDMPLEISQ